MKRLRFRWSRALTHPLSHVITKTVGRFGGTSRRRLHSLEAAIAAAYTERDRLRGELQDLVQYTDAEILQLNQTIDELQQERDDLQLKLWLLEESIQQAEKATLEAVDSSERVPAPARPPQGKAESGSDVLSGLRIALVGGHSATRRGVIQELKGRYGLKHCVEIPRMTESNTNRSRVKAKIGRCDLVVIITGYMGHRLSEIVYSLKAADALAGDVLQLNCRGKSGVVREIMNHLGDAQKAQS
ncbi:MAG: hypothetical protein AAF289_13820 [Cyanobacteria bacterium P01_A01_bin.135]